MAAHLQLHPHSHSMTPQPPYLLQIQTYSFHFFHGLDGEPGSGGVSVAYGSPLTHGGNRYGSNRSGSALQWCSLRFYIRHIQRNAEREKRRTEESSFHRDTPFPLSLSRVISTTDLRIQHISLEVLSFSCSVWEQATAKISVAPRKRFARSAVLSSIPTISSHLSQRFDSTLIQHVYLGHSP